MEWKYVKPLSSPECVREFENLAGYTFPDDFRQCIFNNNGGRPARRMFDTDVQKERVLKSFLSFNKEDRETVWKIRDWNKAALPDRYAAFAIDPFGNLVCFDTSNGKVIFWNHENGHIEQIADSFMEFMECLYE